MQIGLNLSQGSVENTIAVIDSQLIENGLLVLVDRKTKIGNF